MPGSGRANRAASSAPRRRSEKLTGNEKNVLLVDGDSQVNLTALALGFDRFDSYYEDESTRLLNIKDAVAPVFEGKPAALQPFDCPTAENNSNLFILPGHADLAEYEGQISLAQETMGSLSVMKNLPGALHALVKMIEEGHKIDYTIIDLNPGLGAINQNFFMASDFFIVPTNPDPFSLMAVGTLATHLTRWNDWKQANRMKFDDADYPLYNSIPIFLGTLNSRFNKHASKAAKKFDQRIAEIDGRVQNFLVPRLACSGMVLQDRCYQEAFDLGASDLAADNKGKYALARIPDFQALIHTSNISNCPIFSLDETMLNADDIVGVVKDNAMKNIDSFNTIYETIASKIVFLTNDDCRKV
jgi:chromosome partitioning protein